MTRSGGKLWWAVLVAGVTGLLLGLVVLVRGPAPPAAMPEVDQVRGSAAVAGVGAGSTPTSTDQRWAGRRDEAARPQGVLQVTRSEADPPRRQRLVPPTGVQVPSIGLDLPARPVGVDRRGQMRLPADPRVTGWYRFGPAPGSGAGSVVLAGHVDSRRYGIGPLAKLGGVAAGDRVVVRLGSQKVVEYRVDSIERFDRQALPDAVFVRGGPERLRLVTCTGAWLPEAGGYQQNLVVTAVPVG